MSDPRPESMKRIARAVWEGCAKGLKFEDAVIHIHPSALADIIIAVKPYTVVDYQKNTIYGVNFVSDDLRAVDDIRIRWEVKV
jgi:hypothetical protein